MSDLSELSNLHVSGGNFGVYGENIQTLVDYLTQCRDMKNNVKFWFRASVNVASVLTNGEENGNWECMGVIPANSGDWTFQYILYRGLSNTKIYVGSLSSSGELTSCAVFSGATLI